MRSWVVVGSGNAGAEQTCKKRLSPRGRWAWPAVISFHSTTSSPQYSICTLRALVLLRSPKTSNLSRCRSALAVNALSASRRPIAS
jgi:hypothetical protein